MLDEVVGGLFKLIGRFLYEVFFELVLEILIKGPGYLILKSIKRSPVNPDGAGVIIVGVLFWSILGLLVYVVMNY